MELGVKASELREALDLARHATPANPSVVAYSGVQLVATDDALSLTGFDGDFSVRATLPATVTSPGSFLVQPRPLASYLATLDDQAPLVLRVKDSDLEIVADGAKPYRFRAVTAAFPAPPRPTVEPTPANFSRFGSALTAVRPAVNRDTQAVQVISDSAGLVLHATDNYRLARAQLPEASFGEFRALVPLPVLERASRAGVNAVQIDPASRIVAFCAPSVTLTTRLLASEFPAVEGVLSAAPPSRVRIPVKDVLRALSPLAALTESSAELTPVSVSIDGNRMVLSASNADTGSGLEEVSLPESITAPFSFQVRLSYLREAFAALSGPEVTLAYSSGQQPLYLLTEQPVATTVVIMPVRG